MNNRVYDCCSCSGTDAVSSCSNINLISSNQSVGITKVNECLYDLTISPSGLLNIFTQSSNSIIFSGNGSSLYRLRATAKLSTQTDNQLTILSDGLYVSPDQEADPVFSNDIFG